jgi:hypothetical protein
MLAKREGRKGNAHEMRGNEEKPNPGPLFLVTEREGEAKIV